MREQESAEIRHFPQLARLLLYSLQPQRMRTKLRIKGANIMFNTDIKHSFLAAVAALVLTATAVGAAVGPAEAGNGRVFAAATQLDVSARA